MKMRKLVALPFILMLVLMASGPSAAGNGATVTKVPYDGVIQYNPCTNEDMQYFGSFLIVSRSGMDANGSQHFFFKALSAGLGAVGLTTGQSYKVIGSEPNEGGTLKADGSGPYSFANRYAFISKSSDFNWFVTVVFKLTVNANGVPIVERFNSFTECR